MSWQLHTRKGILPDSLSTQQVLQALSAGSLTGTEWARPSGKQDWRPLSTIDVFRHFCGSVETSPTAPPGLQVRVGALCASVLLAFGVGLALL